MGTNDHPDPERKKQLQDNGWMMVSTKAEGPVTL